MENAVDALKIAFGMLVFVIALTLAFMVFSQATQTSNKMLFASDKTNYYTYSEEADKPEGRIVSADVVISSLYRYYKESIVVRIVYSNGDTIEFNTETDGKSSQKARKDNVSKWIQDNKDNLEGTFLETFDEVKKGGEYIIDEEDDSEFTVREYREYDDALELVVKQGQTSIYITYTKQ